MEILVAASAQELHGAAAAAVGTTVPIASTSAPKRKAARGKKEVKQTGHISHTRTQQKFSSVAEIQKYDKKRDRNNVAVRKCREKKRLETDALNKRVKDLEQNNMRLTEELIELR